MLKTTIDQKISVLKERAKLKKNKLFVFLKIVNKSARENPRIRMFLFDVTPLQSKVVREEMLNKIY